MSQLKNLEGLTNNANDIIAVKKALCEIHQVLSWVLEWLQNIEEKISGES